MPPGSIVSPRVSDADMLTLLVGLPELDGACGDGIYRPVRGDEVRVGGESALGLFDRVCTGWAINERLAFLADQRDRSCPYAAGAKIGCIHFRGAGSHRASNANLPRDRRPVERQCCGRAAHELNSLGTSSVRGKPPSVILEVFEDQRASIGVAGGVVGRQGHGVWFHNAVVHRLPQPASKQLGRRAGHGIGIELAYRTGEHR